MSLAQHDEDPLFEERLRSGTYSLLAGLLAAPPDDGMLKMLETIEEEEGTPESSDLMMAWSALKRTAKHTQASAVSDEYQRLFIGLGRGELLPYGSWYLTGFLMESPLGELRRDLAALGYERQEHCREPEDHAAALCEVMAMLIKDRAVSAQTQRGFFETHLGSWMGAFFKDLERAKSAYFYRAVGRLGGEFIKIEKRYLDMPG